MKHEREKQAWFKALFVMQLKSFFLLPNQMSYEIANNKWNKTLFETPDKMKGGFALAPLGPVACLEWFYYPGTTTYSLFQLSRAALSKLHVFSSITTDHYLSAVAYF